MSEQPLNLPQVWIMLPCVVVWSSLTNENLQAKSYPDWYAMRLSCCWCTSPPGGRRWVGIVKFSKLFGHGITEVREAIFKGCSESSEGAIG